MTPLKKIYKIYWHSLPKNIILLLRRLFKGGWDYAETLAGRKLENFKILLPEYKGFKIYLGLAALAFEDDAVEEARKYGVGLLQQVGETVEYAADWEVKAYWNTPA